MKFIDTSKNFFFRNSYTTFSDNIFRDEDGEIYIVAWKDGESRTHGKKFYFTLTFSKELKKVEKIGDVGIKETVVWETFDNEGNIKYRIGKNSSVDIYEPYEKLLSKSSNLNYAEKLKALEWREKRETVIKRENNICEICLDECFSTHPDSYFKNNKNEIDLKNRWANVHHTYYVNGSLPWHYPTESLRLLCTACHQNLHKTTKIIVYKNHEFYTTVKQVNCSKCSGTGYLPEYYYHCDGVCFDCDGTGYMNLKSRS